MKLGAVEETYIVAPLWLPEAVRESVAPKTPREASKPKPVEEPVKVEP